MSCVYHYILIVLAFGASLCAAETADFLLVHNPKGLTILDRFQQHLAPAAVKTLGRGIPFRIIKMAESLGDELTVAHRVSYGSEVYFLVLNEAGELPGDKTNTELLKNCGVLADTIRIKKEQTLYLQNTPQGQGPREFLSRGEMLCRRLKYRNSFYVQRTGRRTDAGWSSLSPGAAWEIVSGTVTSAGSSTVLTVLLEERIRERMAMVNGQYRNYFKHFNSRASQPRTVPQWEYHSTPAGPDCKWQGDQATFSGLQKSTRVLLQDLENILLGKAFAVTLKGTSILIRPEAEKSNTETQSYRGGK